jgi:hypothetical protein
MADRPIHPLERIGGIMIKPPDENPDSYKQVLRDLRNAQLDKLSHYDARILLARLKQQLL